MSNLIRVAIFAPGTVVACDVVANHLKHMQEIVDGYIDMLQMNEGGICPISNGESKIEGFPAN